MTANALLLRYRPTGGGSSLPALAVALGAHPSLAALGVAGGQPFDPRPFASTFPVDADQTWVFAEWTAAIQALIDDGATSQELHGWLETHAGPVFHIEAADALAALSAPPLLDEPAAIEAVSFLLRECAAGAVSREPVRLPASKQLRPDLLLVDATGRPVVVVEVKQRSSDAGLAVTATLLSLADGSLSVLDVNDPLMPQQLRDWLAARGLSRPSA